MLYSQEEHRRDNGLLEDLYEDLLRADEVKDIAESRRAHETYHAAKHWYDKKYQPLYLPR